MFWDASVWNHNADSHYQARYGLPRSETGRIRRAPDHAASAQRRGPEGTRIRARNRARCWWEVPARRKRRHVGALSRMRRCRSRVNCIKVAVSGYPPGKARNRCPTNLRSEISLPSIRQSVGLCPTVFSKSPSGFPVTTSLNIASRMLTNRMSGSRAKASLSRLRELLMFGRFGRVRVHHGDPEATICVVAEPEVKKAMTSCHLPTFECRFVRV